MKDRELIGRHSVMPYVRRSIWSEDNFVEILTVHLSLLVERFLQTYVRKKDKPWFDDNCRHALEL